MELRHLRYFVAVAEELHFGRAAERLHMAQQPLSRQIRALEDDIGVRLFHRTKRTVRLTEAGAVFLNEARKTLHQARLAVLQARQTGHGERGRLAVGFTGSALNSVLPALVRRFKALYPQVELVLEYMPTDQQVTALTAGHLQIGLLHPPIADADIQLATLYREPLVVALAAAHPLAPAAPDPLSITDLARESFILFPRRVGPVLYDRIIGFCQQAGFSPRVVQEVAAQQTILGLVAIGMGITLIHASIERLGQTGVVIRPLREPAPELELAMAWRTTSTHPIAPRFLAVSREMARMGWPPPV